MSSYLWNNADERRRKALLDNLAAETASPGIDSIVEDTTPQLGGDLDANGNNILFDDATGLQDDSGNELLTFGKTSSAVNELKLSNAATNGDVTLEVTGGDDNADLLVKAKGTGVVKEDGSIIIQPVDGAVSTSTGDGKAYFVIPRKLDGANLVRVWAGVATAGTTNTLDIQIANVTDSVDMLSTKLTIDSGETTSATAAAAAVIDTTKDDVAENDILRIDVDAVHSTPAQGLIIKLDFAHHS